MKLEATYFAILLLIMGNLFASLSDVAVKLLNGEISTFQYIFIRQLLSVIVIGPLWIQLTKQQRQIHTPMLHIARAHLIILGSGCMFVAITHLPLATANAVFYAGPLLMLPLSAVLLRESPSITNILLALFGFIGVLVVLRPSEFHWAAWFALGTAVTLALFNISARKINSVQPLISTLFWTSLLSLPVSGFLAILYWQPTSIKHLLLILCSAGLILAYNGLAVRAYQRAPAVKIAIAENSGLVFVALFGFVWFNEIPDWLTALGIAMILLPLMPWKVLLGNKW